MWWVVTAALEAAAAADCPLCGALVVLAEPDPHPIHRPAVVKTNKTQKDCNVAIRMKSPGGSVWNLVRDYVDVYAFDISHTA
jgi:hypothetical protein